MRFQQNRDASCHQVSFFLQGKAPKEIHTILTETLAGFLPGRAKDLSAPLYVNTLINTMIHTILTETLAGFLPGRAKDLSAPLYVNTLINSMIILVDLEATVRLRSGGKPENCGFESDQQHEFWVALRPLLFVLYLGMGC